jgi:hypothetical protein
VKAAAAAFAMFTWGCRIRQSNTKSSVKSKTYN